MGHSEIVRLCEGGLRPPFAITYREEDHQYWIDGVSVPSVTQVVDQLMNFSADFESEKMRRARARGTAIHKACELFIRGELDWSTVDDSIYPEARAFAEWWPTSRIKPLLVEEIVGSKTRGFAGRLDLFGIWKTGFALIDFKTGAEYPPYAAQTAGLEIALLDMLGNPRRANIQRYCLYLKGDTVRPVQHTDAFDRGVFLAALTCSHYRREKYP